MIGGEYYRYTDSGAFITCNPSPGGELGLGSLLTKNKSIFSDYHLPAGNGDMNVVGRSWILASSDESHHSGLYISHPRTMYYNYDFGCRLSKT